MRLTVLGSASMGLICGAYPGGTLFIFLHVTFSNHPYLKNIGYNILSTTAEQIHITTKETSYVQLLSPHYTYIGIKVDLTTYSWMRAYINGARIHV